MYKIDFTHPIHIHFIGIGGISMSGFAELLHTMGFTISGSDASKSRITEHLESLGIHIIYGQSSSNITSDIDLAVFTAAINEDNSEYVAALEAGIPLMDRAEMVGQVMSNYQSSLAVSGTHGKTTTTSMLSHIFLAAGLDPTISVGGILPAIDGNLRIGKSGNFITEACEYTNSFLKFRPTSAVILNIEEDHLDFFKDINDIRSSFSRFAELLPINGILVINAAIDDWKHVTEKVRAKVVTYDLHDSSCDFSAENISFGEMGRGEFDVVEHGSILGHIKLNMGGLHNISNALAAIALSLSLSVPISSIQEGLSQFYGTDRRFQLKGIVSGITIIDDYAHHPTEIKATLDSAVNYPHGRLWCVFQPHTYTRTKAFLTEFAQALSAADKIVLADIYAAREKDPGDISSRDLMCALENLGKDVNYFSSFDEIENFLLENCEEDDLLITMGAGNVFQIGESLLGL